MNGSIEEKRAVTVIQENDSAPRDAVCGIVALLG